jgi:hypothetical protein
MLPLSSFFLYEPLESFSVADPNPGSGAFLTAGSGIRCLFDLWIRDPGWVKNQDPDPGSGSGINNPDHISESLEIIFWVKILEFFDADSGWKKFGSGINIPGPQHWIHCTFTVPTFL